MKIKISICLLLFCSIIFTACSAPSAAPAKKFGDVTLPPNALSQEAAAAGIITDTFGTSYTSACYDANYRDLNVLTETATYIISCRINDMSYVCGEKGTAFTLHDVTVLEVLKGDLEAGDTICVAEAKGIVSMADYQNSFTPEEWEGRIATSFVEESPEILVMSEEEKKNTYFEVTNGTPANEVGDTVLYYLQDGEISTVEGGLYAPIADDFGRFVENPVRGFFRYGIGDTREEMLEPVAQFAADGQANDLSESALNRKHYSLDELKQIIDHPTENSGDIFGAEPAS